MTDDEPATSVRVLVVDDHADVRFLVRVILQEAGPPLVVAGEAAGAQEAIDTMDEVAPDAVVLDARMPLVDGFEAAAMILARRPGLPILLCSAVVDDETRERARAAGIAACLSEGRLRPDPGRRVGARRGGRSSLSVCAAGGAGELRLGRGSGHPGGVWPAGDPF